MDEIKVGIYQVGAREHAGFDPVGARPVVEEPRPSAHLVKMMKQHRAKMESWLL